jgi:hypothetical protein
VTFEVRADRRTRLLITSDKQAGAGMDAPSGLPGDARASTGRIRLHRGLPAKSDEAIVPVAFPLGILARVCASTTSAVSPGF